MKIVVPVDKDKSTIVKRTGRAPFYAIYEGGKLVDFVANHYAQDHEDKHEHHNHAHSEGDHHKKVILKLQGCDLILAQAVGKGMQNALQSANIAIQKLAKDDGTTAAEVVEKFLAHKLKSQL